MERPQLPLPQLHAFVVLAEELHFGRAAERLGIAQPPLSQQIRRLGEKVGHALFSRTPGRVTLTPAGRALLPAAERAITELADGPAAARTTVAVAWRRDTDNPLVANLLATILAPSPEAS